MAQVCVMTFFVMLFVCCHSGVTVFNNNPKFSYNNLQRSLEKFHQLQLMRSIIYIHNGNSNLSRLALAIVNVKAPVYQINFKTIDFMQLEKYNQILIKEESKLYFVVINFNEDFVRILDKIRQLPFWKAIDRIIFLSTSKIIKNIMKNCFKICWKFNILNVLFVNNNLSVFSYNLFLKALTVIKERNLEFPKTTSNLHGTKLKLVYYNTKFIFGRTANETYVDKDAMMSDALMKAINATYEFVSPDDNVFLGQCNATHLTGALKTLLEGGGDVAMNQRSYVYQHCGGKIEYTYPLDRSDIVIGIIKEKPVLRSLGSVFPTFLWVILLLSMIVFFIYLKMVKNSHTFVEVLLIIVQIITGQAAKELKIKFFRIALSATVVLLIFFNTIFQSRLFSFLTVVEPVSQIETIEEFLDSGKTFSCAGDGCLLIQKSFDGALKRKIQERMVIKKEREMLNIMMTCQGNIAISYNLIRIIDRKRCFYTVKEALVPSVKCYILIKDSPFSVIINKFLLKLRENGLQEYWKKQQMETRQAIQFAEHGSITFKSLLIAFYILIVGNVFACIIFILEIYWNYD